MKWSSIHIALLALSLFCAGEARSFGQSQDLTQPSLQLERERASPLLPTENDDQQARSPEWATIRGTVTDINDQPVAGATITLEGPQLGQVRTAMTDGLGFYEMGEVEPGIPYHITVNASGFARWESSSITLKPGRHETLDVSKLRIEEFETNVTVRPEASEEIAIEQVRVEEKQRGLGIIPNFFAVYDRHPEPLTARLKFDLAFRVLRDPFTLGGVAVLAGIGQAAGNPAYVQGLRGYAERFGANYTNQATSILIGGAVLPSLLRQDPRYFYKGDGSKMSRAVHALSNLVITKGDSGRTEPNFSSLGGDLASGAIASIYYPQRDEKARIIFESFAINTAVHAGVRLLQEFVFRPQKGTVLNNSGVVAPTR